MARVDHNFGCCGNSSRKCRRTASTVAPGGRSSVWLSLERISFSTPKNKTVTRMEREYPKAKGHRLDERLHKMAWVQTLGSDQDGNISDSGSAKDSAVTGNFRS